MTTADTSTPAATVRPKKDPRDTPAMRQHTRFKAQFPDCVLLFRMGDFYELFFDDAVEVAKAIGLTLTERSPGVPMAGVPHHAADGYIKKILDAGFRVAIADQIQDPKDAKGVVDRAVTRVLTPGTLVDDSLLSDDTTRLIAAASVFEGTAHLATIDASTGAFSLASFHEARLADELARRPIAEVLIPEDRDGNIAPALTNLPVETTPRPGWMFRLKESHEALREQFGVTTLAGFGITDDAPTVGPAGALVRHLRETQSPNGDASALTHLAPPIVERDASRLQLDATSLRALEIEHTLRAGTKDLSLFGVLLATAGRRTAMGKRLVRQWLREPLADLSAIEARHACVATLVTDARTSEALASALENVQDVARIAGRLGAGRATPRDVAALGLSLARLPELASVHQKRARLRSASSIASARCTKHSRPSPPTSPPASKTALPPTPARATSSATTSTKNSTPPAHSAATPPPGSPNTKQRSPPSTISQESRSATTKSSATTSSSPPSRRKTPPTPSPANKLSKTPSATSRPSSKSSSTAPSPPKAAPSRASKHSSPNSSQSCAPTRAPSPPSANSSPSSMPSSASPRSPPNAAGCGPR